LNQLLIVTWSTESLPKRLMNCAPLQRIVTSNQFLNESLCGSMDLLAASFLSSMYKKTLLEAG